MKTLEVIKQMRNDQKTYQEIADFLNITRQRVHQIFKNYKSTPESIRNLVIIRDDEKCIICDNNEDLEVHHINGIKKDNGIDNLVTLCRKCHSRIKKEDRKTIKKEKGEKRYFHYSKRKNVICKKCSKKFIIIDSRKGKNHPNYGKRKLSTVI